MERIKATYWIETPYPVEKAAEALAGEQSCGTFLKVPGETQELKERHGAVVERIEVLGQTTSPSLPGSAVISNRDAHSYNRALLEVSWPMENVGPNLSNLMATVAGNLFELKQFSGIRLKDLTLPPSFFTAYPGPQFGIEGTKELIGVWDRPIIGTIIKPSIGLSPKQTAERTRILIDSGLDFLKDDELMGNPPHSPFEKRVDAVMEVILAHAQKTGKKAMYAFNITGDLDDMIHRHDYVVKKGGNCVMVSLNWVGIGALVKLRKHCTVPIHGHRNGWGILSRSPFIGIDFKVFQTIWRLVGADHLHTNGLQNKFCEDDISVIQSIKACQNEIDGKRVMPVISSGQWAGQVEDTYKAIANTDLMYVCGGGIVGHPLGIEAGVKSIKQAWEAAINGISLATYAEEHIELKESLRFFTKLHKT